MNTFTKAQQKNMSHVVTFMVAWSRHQAEWVAADVGSDAEAKAKEQKQFYASLSHRNCVKLGLNPVDIIGTPACQDANEYDRQIMKEVEAERAA